MVRRYKSIDWTRSGFWQFNGLTTRGEKTRLFPDQNYTAVLEMSCESTLPVFIDSVNQYFNPSLEGSIRWARWFVSVDQPFLT